MDPDERVKPRLSEALTRGARPDSNSRHVVQISSPMSSRYVPWGQLNLTVLLMSMDPSADDININK